LRRFFEPCISWKNISGLTCLDRLDSSPHCQLLFTAEKTFFSRYQPLPAAPANSKWQMDKWQRAEAKFTSEFCRGGGIGRMVFGRIHSEALGHLRTHPKIFESLFHNL
jgi:hypothetical protein